MYIYTLYIHTYSRACAILNNAYILPCEFPKFPKFPNFPAFISHSPKFPRLPKFFPILSSAQLSSAQLRSAHFAAFIAWCVQRPDFRRGFFLFGYRACPPVVGFSIV